MDSFTILNNWISSKINCNSLILNGIKLLFAKYLYINIIPKL